MAFQVPKKLSVFLNTSFLFLLCLHLLYHHVTTQPSAAHLGILRRNIASHGCSSLHDLPDSESKCLYVQTDPSCSPKGFINYLLLFYCTYGHYPLVSHSLLLLWLAVLFYLLGNTAALYFCSNLEGLSKVLRLSPTIAGVTLLSLGNGAPDVFASIVSFTKSGNGDVGLNSILGGAFFVSSVVVGVIGISVGPRRFSVDRISFFRDVSFFLFALLSLLLIIVIGKISFLGAIAYVSIYFLYVCSVSVMQILGQKKQIESVVDFSEKNIPLIGCVDEQKPTSVDTIAVEDQVPSVVQRWKSHVLSKLSSYYSYLRIHIILQWWESRILSKLSSCYHYLRVHIIVQWWKSKILDKISTGSCYYYLGCIWSVLELPLYLPRRLTIPLVSEDDWSKPYGVVSAASAPLFLAALCNSQMESTEASTRLVTYMVAGLSGVVLGNLAYVTTETTSPPKDYLFPWLAGGFLMSVTWTYIIAEELVSLLVSYGAVLGINASVLGLTILAWGNSLGDLIANVAMAINGGPDGAQIAISGCYAGPMFYTLMGLGLPLVMSSWAEYPAAYVIPVDHSLYETIGFLIGGLLWALVVLPNKDMRLDRFLGGGLLAIYSCFLFLTVARTIGLLNL